MARMQSVGRRGKAKLCPRLQIQLETIYGEEKQFDLDMELPGFNQLEPGPFEMEIVFSHMRPLRFEMEVLHFTLHNFGSIVDPLSIPVEIFAWGAAAVQRCMRVNNASLSAPLFLKSWCATAHSLTAHCSATSSTVCPSQEIWCVPFLSFLP